MTSANLPEVLIKAISTKPEWTAKPIKSEIVHGGITNSNYKLWIGEEGPIFAKVPGPGTEKFINRTTANQAATQAHAVGISPAVLHFDRATGIEFAHFVEDGYRTATTLDFQNESVCRSVMETYRAWHTTDRLSETKTMVDMVEEHLSQVRDENIALPHWSTDVLNNYELAVDAFMKDGLELVPAHNDPMPGNFLLGPEGEVKLIDFDYAANNEASYELGLILTEMFVDVERSRDLVQVYRGEHDERFFARAMLSRMIADTKWGLWGLINNHARDEDFDYYKYGTWKLYRTFWVSRRDEYSSWLEAAK